MPSEKWRDGGVCLRLPIRHIRDVNGFLSEDIRLYFGAVRWSCRYTNFAVTSKTVASGHSLSFGIGQIFWLPVS